MNISPGENISMALAALWTHRFRSILTILGIVIGITTVVTVASLLTGLRAGVVTFFDQLGPDNIFVFKTSGDPNAPFESTKERKRRAIKPEYADLIRRFSNAVQDVGLTLYVPPAVTGSIITASGDTAPPGHEDGASTPAIPAAAAHSGRDGNIAHCGTCRPPTGATAAAG